MLSQKRPTLYPRHTAWRPRCDHGDLRNPPDRRMVAGFHKSAPLCDCNRDRAALAWLFSSLTRDLYEPNCVSITTSASVRRSYHDLIGPTTHAQCAHRRHAHTTTSQGPRHTLIVPIGDYQRSECELQRCYCNLGATALCIRWYFEWLWVKMNGGWWGEVEGDRISTWWMVGWKLWQLLAFRCQREVRSCSWKGWLVKFLRGQKNLC